ncbi:MAG: acetate--CoA ligase family protein, partial [Pseudomonadota bacterium]
VGQAAQALGFPVVLKGSGAAHKTEAGLVRLHLQDADQVRQTAQEMATDKFLVEEMVGGGIAELLLGVVRDPAHGFVLTLGAGGVMTEILADTQSLLLPVTRKEIKDALSNLRIFPILEGYRGKPAADIEAIVAAVLAVQDYVIANAARLDEVEINPLICCSDRAVAADALIRIGDEGWAIPQ